ncbi:hypothetical protein GYMLUDRAFT_76760 [Collybiopsis luxurians FD-317 M1]|uniref:Unplaced genomic scaffold GYMLUscaffold_62, whole genome shotgun sequence n=1 Tax=Collybiopsis luxurians FD-317 M1 TaxID=944289 RepID=A0A0D0CJ71_9AGAR|nr:hypothetical protein GYMLUDRAFT_76760 [Collybiopsis luxurians FD-317 M1]
MQSKLIIALALSCLSAFVAASPVPVPAPAPAVRDRFKLPRFESLAREDTPVAREGSDVEEREPEPICRYDCI